MSIHVAQNLKYLEFRFINLLNCEMNWADISCSSAINILKEDVPTSFYCILLICHLLINIFTSCLQRVNRMSWRVYY